MEKFMADTLNLLKRKKPERCLGREEVGALCSAEHMHLQYRCDTAHRWAQLKKTLDSKVSLTSFFEICIR